MLSALKLYIVHTFVIFVKILTCVCVTALRNVCEGGSNPDAGGTV